MFSPLPFFHNIGYIIQSLIGRDNDHLIPDAHHVLTVRHDQHTVTVNRCDQQIFFRDSFSSGMSRIGDDCRITNSSASTRLFTRR